MQEFFMKHSIQFCVGILFPFVFWVRGLFKEKNEFKAELKALNEKHSVLDKKVDDNALKSEHHYDKLSFSLSAINETLKKVEINTAVNTSKLDDK